MPSRRTVAQKIRAAVCHLGVARTMQLMVHRSIPSWVFDLNSHHAVETNFEDWNFVSTPDDWPYRWGTEDDAELLTGGGFSLDYVRYLFGCGGRPVLLERDGELVTYVWYLPDGVLNSDWLRIVPRPRELASKGHQVLPKFRGQGIYQRTRNFAGSQLSAEGYLRHVSTVEVLNRASLRAGKGWRPGTGPRRHVGRISYLRILGLVVFRLSGSSGARKWGAGFWNRKRPYQLSFDFFHEKDTVSS